MILFQRKYKKFLSHKLILIFFISFVLASKLSAQLTLGITGQDNTICGGSPCSYEGPTILINEVMLMPDNYDGCMFGTFGGGDCEGEWIELYNPNACNSVDISCYFLGNCAKDGWSSKYGAGFALPVGTIVPPLGFCIVRGVNAPAVPPSLLVSNGGNTVEVVVEDYPSRVCLDGGNRLWFPNAGGWFAFYDENGVAQDAINWGSQADMECNPCNPDNCSFVGTLAKGDDITNITNISGGVPLSGKTFRRIPDGSAWDVGITAPPTYGTCNSTCATPVVFTCDGEATVTVLTGTSPYNYIWDNGQIVQTAIGLCAGQHCVTVTDANESNSICIYINEPPPPVVNLNDTAICSGNSVILDAENPGSVYEWNTGGTTQTITISLAGNYSVTVTDINNCIGSDSMIATIYPNPVADAGSYQNICNGDSIMIGGSPTASGGTSSYTYLWSPLAGLSSSTVSNPYAKPVVATTYTVTITDSNGCTDTDDVVVSIYPNPNADAKSDTTICNGECVTLFASGAGIGGSYLWSTSEITDSITVCPVVTTTYTLTAIDSNGCTDVDSVEVSIYPSPVADAGNDTSVCDGSGIILTASGGTSYNWNTGDATASITVSPVVVTTYTVTVTDDGNGCTDVDSVVVIINPLPVSDFSYTEVCLNDTTYFTDISNGSGSPIVLWDWDFGNGNTSTNQNPSNLYLFSGNYNVSLIIANANGCRDTITKNVIVDSLPVAGFVADTVCLGYQTSFTDTSLSFDSPNILWDWDFGDGNTSTEQNPFNLYLTPGSHTVQLIVTNQNGCKDTAVNNVIVDSLPVSDFSYTEVCLNDTTYFTDLSDGSGVPIVSWDWNFDDGNTSTDQNPYNLYLSPGNYNVSLIVINANGCRDTIAKNVAVDSLPVAGFVTDTVCLGYQTSFTDTSLSFGSPNVSWLWDFSDGATSTDQNSVHIFTTPGLHTVQLVIINQDGCTDIAINTVVVDSLPVPNFSYTEVCLNDTTYFTDMSDGSGVPIVSWLWDFGDGNTSTNQNSCNLYLTPGNHSVSLIVFNSNGCTDIIIKNIVVDSLPIPDFSYEYTCLGDITHFTDMSDGAGALVVLWDWNFGDGNTSTVWNPSHLYLTEGDYNVSLVVVNSNGCIDSIIKVVTIDSLPVAGFVAGTVCLGEYTTFTDTSLSFGSSNILWDWDFGDGDTSIVQNPVHVFTTPGSHTVQLIVTNQNGCKDTAVNTVVIDSLPVAGFVADTVCLGVYTTFTDTSLSFGSPNVSWDWDFGDGGTSTEQNPSNLYLSSGLYSVQLIATNQNGCKDTIIKNVIVDSLPVPDFSYASVCFGDTTYFTDMSDGAGALVISWNWDFGDGDTSSVQNPSHLYSSVGDYNVLLIVVNSNGCVDSITKNVSIYPYPVANFSFTPANGCEPLTVQFTDFSIYVNDYYWDFGDSTISTEQNPLHIYQDDGIYSVTLYVVGDGGCSDTLFFQDTITVYPNPNADFDYQNVHNPPPNNGTIQFTNLTTGAIIYDWDLGDGTTSTEVDPNHRYDMYGTYLVTLIATTEYGCKDTVEKEIGVDFFKGLFVPNAFCPTSPYPEVQKFIPKGFGIKEYHIVIYDTWGNLLWESSKLIDTEPAESWDGYYNGKLLSPDVYVWKVRATFYDESTWKGKKYDNGVYRKSGTVTIVK